MLELLDLVGDCGADLTWASLPKNDSTGFVVSGATLCWNRLLGTSEPGVAFRFMVELCT